MRAVISLLVHLVLAACVASFAIAKDNSEEIKKYFKGMLEQGIYLAPSQYEALFVSSAHSERDIQTTILAMREVFTALRI